MAGEQTLRFGRFAWQPARRRLLADGTPLPLGARAIDLLAALFERRDRVVTKGELLDLVWPNLVVEENNLQVQVSALRKALGPDVIATVPGRGYRLTLELDGSSTDEERKPLQPAADGLEGNLPRLPPPIGRDDELETLAALVLAHPQVTVTGTGGIGKTRLAIAAAARLQAHWRDGVWWVDLAALTDPEQLPLAVARALQLSLGSGEPSTRLAAAMRPRELLLVLDNCEHLLDATGALARALLAAAPQLHLLATSQQRLNLGAEQVFALPPLALPAAGEADPDGRCGAVALFTARARAADPRFTLGPDNAAAVAGICRRLDGLPLAIELAAARVRLLGVPGLADRLDERLRLLTGGARDAPPRHRTLRAALDWSHSLLDATEQVVLRRLGVFVGGFTLELVQRLAADEGSGPLDDWAVLDALATLADKSLIAVEPGEPPRYRLLETMRAFALEQLAKQGELHSLRRRHARVIHDLFVDVDEQRNGDGGRLGSAALMQLLAPEIDNARAALDWALADGGEPATAVALAAASAAVFTQLGLTREHLPRLRRLRAQIDAAPPACQVNLLFRLGLAIGIGAPSHAEQLEVYADAVRRARSAGSLRRLQAALGSLGWAHVAGDDFEAAQRVVDELASLEGDGEPRVRFTRLGVLARMRHRRHDHEGAVSALREQEELLRRSMPDDTLNCLLVQVNLCTNLGALGRHEDVVALARPLLAHRELPRGLHHLAFDLIVALCELGRAGEGLAVARERRRDWHLAPLRPFVHALAALALAGDRLADTGRLLAAARRPLPAGPVDIAPELRRVGDRWRRRCAEAGVSLEDSERWRREGESLDDDALLALAMQVSD